MIAPVDVIAYVEARGVRDDVPASEGTTYVGVLASLIVGFPSVQAASSMPVVLASALDDALRQARLTLGTAR